MISTNGITDDRQKQNYPFVKTANSEDCASLCIKAAFRWNQDGAAKETSGRKIENAIILVLILRRGVNSQHRAQSAVTNWDVSLRTKVTITWARVS